MARPTLPADGVKPWGTLLRNAIYDISDRADSALSSITSILSNLSTLTTTVNGNTSSLSTLSTAVASKAADNAVVHLAGTETVIGTKTFSVAPAVPDNAFAITKVANLQTTLSGLATTGHTHTSTQITDFVEAAQDAIAPFLVAGTNVTLTHNDVANTLTIAATGTGGGGLDAEGIRDTIATALVGTGVITVTVNDAADTITISSTATVNSTDAALRDRTTHTGTQAISTITNLQTTLDSKATSSELTQAQAIDEASTVLAMASGRRLRDSYLQGMVESGVHYRIKYTGSAWPALSTVPTLYLNSGAPIDWDSLTYLGAPQPPEMRIGDFWDEQVS